MSDTPRAPGRSPMGPFLVFLALLLLACVAGPYFYFFEDYEYVRGTARELQDTGVFVTRTLAWGLVGLLVGGGAYAALGLVGGFTRWASPAARDVYREIEIARAQHQVLPEGLSSIANTINHYHKPERALIEAPGQQTVIDAEPTPPALAGPSPHEDASFRASESKVAQLVDRGHIKPSANQLLVGYAGGEPKYIRAAEWGLAIIAGQSGKGKSALAKLIIAQAALAGWVIIVCDPVYHREERSLLKHYLAGMSGAIWKQAVTDEEIAAAVGLAMKIAHRRLRGEDKADIRVLLVVDEFATVAGRKVLGIEAMEDLFLTATKAAAVGVHTLLIAHDLSGSWFGGQAARRGRDQATHRLICNMAPTAAASILPNQAYAQQVAVLPVGQALFFDGYTEPALLSFPRLTPDDVAWAAQGQAPKPYQSWVRPAISPDPSSLTPTEPLPGTPTPRAVPPTERLIQAAELVLDALRASRVELDVKEIARRTGLAESTVNTTLGQLRGAGVVTNRREGKRFVYSISPQPATV